MSLDPNVHEVLRHPKRALEVAVPVRMDDGHVATFTAATAGGSRSSRLFLLALAVRATAQACDGLRDASRDRHAESVAEFMAFYRRVLDRFGYRLRRPYTLEQFAEAMAALGEGFGLHALEGLEHPDVIIGEDDEAAAGRWTLFGICVRGLVGEFLIMKDPAEPEPDPRARRRARIRILVTLLLTLLLLAAAAIAVRYFVLNQYYVGVGENDEVAVYQGVSGSILGFDLSTQAEGSCVPGDQLCEPLMIPDLQQDARDAVRSGVKREDLESARNYITFLRHDKQLPECPEPARPEDTGDADGADAGDTAARETERGGQEGVDCRPRRDTGGGR
jgi:hypothetical protein